MIFFNETNIGGKLRSTNYELRSGGRITNYELRSGKWQITMCSAHHLAISPLRHLTTFFKIILNSFIDS